MALSQGFVSSLGQDLVAPQCQGRGSALLCWHFWWGWRQLLWLADSRVGRCSTEGALTPPPPSSGRRCGASLELAVAGVSCSGPSPQSQPGGTPGPGRAGARPGRASGAWSGGRPRRRRAPPRGRAGSRPRFPRPGRGAAGAGPRGPRRVPGHRPSGSKARARPCPGAPTLRVSCWPRPRRRAAGMLHGGEGAVSAGAALQQGESSWRWPPCDGRVFSHAARSINVPLRWRFPPPLGRVAVPGLPRCCDTMLALSAGSCRYLASQPWLWNTGGWRKRSQ